MRANILEKRRLITAAVIVSITVTICLFFALTTQGIHVLSPFGYKNERLAYVTFLSGTVDAGDDLEKDNYFVAVRILIWQLKHNPGTRTKHDVVVMVTPTVSKSRRERLKRDGAIIYPVDFLHTKNDAWIHPEQHRWDDVITKMRVWEMTQYDRILMLDGDSMLRSSLDGVFDDPGAKVLRTKEWTSANKTEEGVDKDSEYKEAALPETYLLGSLSEVWDSTHDFPPLNGTGLKKIGYMNAGFFLLAPSRAAFKYYKSLMNIPNSFDPRYPEQNLMNYAHRWNGPMPWKEVSYHWNIRCPTENDFANGLVSMHEKWWKQPYLYENKKVKEWLLTRRYEMKGWYDAWDAKGNPQAYSNAVDAFAKASCLNFVRHVQARLPQELVNKILDFYWDDWFEHGCATSILDSWDQFPCPGRPCDCLEQWKRPVVINPDFVGLHVARDAVLAYHRRDAHLPKRMCGEEDFRKYLEADRAHVGVKNASVLRFLEIDMHMVLDPRVMDMASNISDAYALPETEINALTENLSVLQLIERKDLFKLDIRVNIYEQKIVFQHLKNLLAKIQPSLRQLDEQGSKIDLRVVGNFHQHHSVPIRLGLGRYITLDKSRWEDQLKEDISQFEKKRITDIDFDL
ncbi:glycosyltransferase family 8 protein [Aaosphaeria arxii CBS 175.79]|uniref:Glycosyltransferase family 8 protein n=1 Tax=Aaosphaeria arxii CBS 175.79 TaxID=1450172 RepID=A0A6A5XNS5_9PLEO|nr:glycosyltransferase family 8 protein [Aaosphaeria arxii CBS 175.79]KAF2014004.1 glycosyltransferase family 8 protein [Aaosphaeria arxii CBS 175.79]